jgi:hypothetical protein
VKTQKFAEQWDNGLMFHTKLKVPSLRTTIRNTKVGRNEHIFLRAFSFHTA